MSITRRSFLKTSSTVAAGLAMPAYLRTALECMESRDRNTACTIETGNLRAKYAHLGNFASRMSGVSLQYDDKNKSFNIAEANKYIKPQYREPWKFPVI